MRLLLDHNLPPRLVRDLADLFPNMQHVRALGLSEAPDLDVWDRARREGFVFVTKDEDFVELVLLLGVPPKIVWIRRGNCTTRDIEAILRENRDAIRSLAADRATAVLQLF